MKLVIFNNLKESEKSSAVKNLISESTPSQDYFLMIILSFAMATFGIIIDSDPVIIGSMLIATMLYPILSLSLGIVISDTKLIMRSLVTIAKSVLFGVGGAVLISLFVYPGGDVLTSTGSLARLDPSLAYVAIAFISGLAASFALTKPHLNDTLPGIAISVSLIPPLASSGIGIALLNWEIIRKSLMLFGINVIGIVFSGILVFSLMNFYIKKNIAQTAIKVEDKALKEEQKKSS